MPPDGRPTGHPLLMTAAEVQALLYVSKSTVNAMREDGRLTAVPVPGGGYRYPRAQQALRPFLELLGASA